MPDDYALTPEGRKVMQILLRQPSGYGREQLLIVALRLACRKVPGQLPPNDPDYARWADAMVLTFLTKAEEVLHA